MLILSLTSIPPRFDRLGSVLSDLVHQTVDAKVELYIPHRYARFPQWDGSLPDVPEGVTIFRSDDFGPATKVLPAVRQHVTENTPILFCDDDATYAPRWADTIMADHTPGTAVAATGFDAKRLGAPTPAAPAGYCDIAQGYSGILIEPNMFDDSAFHIPQDCFLADDLWLSAQLAKSNIAIKLAPAAARMVTLHDNDEHALQFIDRAKR